MVANHILKKINKRVDAAQRRFHPRPILYVVNANKQKALLITPVPPGDISHHYQD